MHFYSGGAYHATGGSLRLRAVAVATLCLPVPLPRLVISFTAEDVGVRDGEWVRVPRFPGVPLVMVASSGLRMSLPLSGRVELPLGVQTHPQLKATLFGPHLPFHCGTESSFYSFRKICLVSDQPAAIIVMRNPAAAPGTLRKGTATS